MRARLWQLTCVVLWWWRYSVALGSSVPVVINTWPFTDATEKAYRVLKDGGTPVDAVEQGCTVCEEEQCDGTVGFGGSPDDQGQITLDAVIQDGTTMDVGAVAALQHIKQAIHTARLVMERTEHSILAGLQATAFAVEMGLTPTNLSTPHSDKLYAKWKRANCQPNYRKNVHPNPHKHCGPYHIPARDDSAAGGDENDGSFPAGATSSSSSSGSSSSGTLHGSSSGSGGDGGAAPHQRRVGHDTIAMVAVDRAGRVAAGASTNGAMHKIAGRVGDAAVAGAGVYADSDVGGCGATGDGDIHLRFMPCVHVVEAMRHGTSPQSACEAAIQRMARFFPGLNSGLVAVDKHGRHGGAAAGWDFFAYSVASHATGGKVEVVKVKPIVRYSPRGGSDADDSGGSGGGSSNGSNGCGGGCGSSSDGDEVGAGDTESHEPQQDAASA